MEALAVCERFISDLGFPIFVATILLYQVIHMHRENHSMIDGLAREIVRLRESVERLTFLLMRSSELKLTIRDQD